MTKIGDVTVYVEPRAARRGLLLRRLPRAIAGRTAIRCAVETWGGRRHATFTIGQGSKLMWRHARGRLDEVAIWSAEEGGELLSVVKLSGRRVNGLLVLEFENGIIGGVFTEETAEEIIRQYDQNERRS